MELNCYTYSVTCDRCADHRFVDHMMVGLPLGGLESKYYYCRNCFLVVQLPGRVENRFLHELSDTQLDVYGNFSWFRTQLANTVKHFATNHKMYSLVTIPVVELYCPEDGTRLELWADNSTYPALNCAKCGHQTTNVVDTWKMGHGVLTSW